MIYAQTRISPGNFSKILCNLKRETYYFILVRRPDLVNKKRTRHLVDFAVPTNFSMKIKETRKEKKIWILPEG